jgi:hypothetical protein
MILSDEQYPVAFDAAILRLKDPISVTSTVDRRKNSAVTKGRHFESNNSPQSNHKVVVLCI